MSLTVKQYKQTQRKDKRFSLRLVQIGPLEPTTLEWMAHNNKGYTSATLTKFKIKQGIMERFDNTLGNGRRAYVCSDPCLVIPAGPVVRCYRYNLPKAERWHVSPPGYGAQWLGDLSKPDLILCEGEWDCLRLNDQGFDNAISHTAGAMTWLQQWTADFTGKRIWICYDRDAIGQRGAAKVARSLHPVTKEIRFIDLPLPGTPESKDISDFFKYGGTHDGFRKLIDSARPRS